MNKKIARIRRATKSRAKIRSLKKDRLTVNRTAKHIYAQVISSDTNKVLASVSTLCKQARASFSSGTANKTAATQVGKLIAERALKNGVKEVAFDRSGYKYHGRVKELAEAARAAGLSF